jgi:DNA polymerase
VFGEGDPNARVVFVGEAPGADEDRTGRPFVGAAGKKLDQIIVAMGLRRDGVYICNVLKARPPKNRTPLPDEVAACAGYLHAQLACIGPDVIVALGGPASKFLLDTNLGITRLRGNWGQWTSPDGRVTCAVMPTFHPAYLLRQYTPEVRGQMWHDMQQVMARLEQRPEAP